MLSELFADEGLVLLDPRTPAMAARAAPLIRFALEEEAAIGVLLEERSAELARRGFQAQVHTRDASLAFFHPAGPAGPRFRPDRDGDGFCTPLGRVSLRGAARAPGGRSALLQHLGAAPPAAYKTRSCPRPPISGGPAECTYFAQLPPLYKLAGVELPMIAPRARFRVVDPWTAGVLARLGLAPEDTDAPVHTLAARLHAWPGWMDGALRERLLGPLERELERVRPEAVALDPALGRNVEKTRAHVARGVDRFIARLQRAVLTSRGVGTSVLESLDQVVAALHPGGRPQERVHGFWAVAAEVGPRALVSSLVAAAAPLSPDVRTVRP